MQITRTLKGHTFSVQLRAVERTGRLLSTGAPIYAAHVTIYRDGVDLGSGRWDEHGALATRPVLADAEDSDAVLRELAVAIRDYLAALPVGIREGSTVRTMPVYSGRRIDRWGRQAGTTGVALTAARQSIGGDVVSVRLEDGSVLPYPVGELEPAPVETPARADVATSMQRVTFAPGLRGDELRRMAGRARALASSLAPIRTWRGERRTWDALADELDAAAERDEAGNAPEAP